MSEFMAYGFGLVVGAGLGLVVLLTLIIIIGGYLGE